jgi:chemotaxis-related protein WspB
MLFLIFKLGKDRYAVEANRVLEVLPLVAVKRLPQAPRGVAGIFNLRGQPVPALDLNELAFGEPARERLTTRIIIVLHTDSSGRNHPLGLIAEQVTQTLHKNPKQFIHSGVTISGAPYLGPIVMDDDGPIQWLNSQHLLTAPIQDLLFSQIPALAHDEH